MLIIKDLDKLKIKRIHGTKIYFSYDNEEYFIKEIDDQFDDYYTEVYLIRKTSDKKSNGYKLEYVSETCSCNASNIYQIISDTVDRAYPFKHKWVEGRESNMVYKFIDKLEFVKILEEDKLVEVQLENK